MENINWTRTLKYALAMFLTNLLTVAGAIAGPGGVMLMLVVVLGLWVWLLYGYLKVAAAPKLWSAFAVSGSAAAFVLITGIVGALFGEGNPAHAAGGAVGTFVISLVLAVGVWGAAFRESPGAAAQDAAAAPSPNMQRDRLDLEQLTKLKALHASGALTDEQFARERKRIVG